MRGTAYQSGRLAKYALVGVAGPLLLMLGGCHHRNVRSARQAAPPPVQGRSSRTDSEARSSRSGSEPAARTTPDPYSAAAPAGASPPLPEGNPSSTEVGIASWYGPPYDRHPGADGSVYNQNAMTAAHRTLPLGTIVRVTNIETGQSVVVRITDRGPFIHGRVLDLSLAAARATGVYRAGTARVRIEAWPPSTGLADASGHWCVQTGAFHRESDALDLRNHLSRRYTTARVIEFAGPTGYWVRVNPRVPDRASAEEVAAGIHTVDSAAEPYIVRTN
jgi:rare lipoprotein A